MADSLARPQYSQQRNSFIVTTRSCIRCQMLFLREKNQMNLEGKIKQDMKEYKPLWSPCPWSPLAFLTLSPFCLCLAKLQIADLFPSLYIIMRREGWEQSRAGEKHLFFTPTLLTRELTYLKPLHHWVIIVVINNASSSGVSS